MLLLKAFDTQAILSVFIVPAPPFLQQPPQVECNLHRALTSRQQHPKKSEAHCVRCHDLQGMKMQSVVCLYVST